jgi:hypothetical protein
MVKSLCATFSGESGSGSGSSCKVLFYSKFLEAKLIFEGADVICDSLNWFGVTMLECPEITRGFVLVCEFSIVPKSAKLMRLLWFGLKV